MRERGGEREREREREGERERERENERGGEWFMCKKERGKEYCIPRYICLDVCVCTCVCVLHMSVLFP